MKCPKCGKENLNGAQFCAMCGSPLQSNTKKEPAKEPKVVKTGATINFFNIMLEAFLKPSKAYNEEKNNLDDIKNGIIFSGIVAAFMMLVNLISTMISSVVVVHHDFFSDKVTRELEFDNIKDLPYFDLIVKRVLIYAAVILAIAGIFFIGALIAKKTVTYMKTLTITAISMIPYTVGTIFAATILGLIWEPLGVIVAVAGVAYSIAIFVSLLNQEVTFVNKDYAIYYFAACFTTTIVIAYYAITKWFASVMSSGIQGIIK